MIPSPPNCIKSKRIDCPKVVKYEPVSTTIRPVTQTALVEVKSASRSPIPSCVALGNISKPVPTNIIPRKLLINS